MKALDGTVAARQSFSFSRGSHDLEAHKRDLSHTFCEGFQLEPVGLFFYTSSVLNTPSTTMFTIVKMSGMLLSDYDMLHLAGSTCWIASRVAGRHGGHFQKGMWLRST